MAERARAVPTHDPLSPDSLIEGEQTFFSITDTTLQTVLTKPGWMWWSLLLVFGGGTALLALCILITEGWGIGEWGNDMPVAWAFGIINFVWWIGFGHAGTFISAILVLFQQKWRAPIHRFAETMTICAVTQAGIFPLIHLGRAEYFYWLIPYPSTLAVWPQFRSSLTWDVVAVMTYLLVSILFWYVGLIPDLAAARDVSKRNWQKTLFAVLCLGWRGSAKQWHHWRAAYLLLAALATALVISVESIVSFDFSIAQLPGWHSTIFPPYFVASAMFAGFALLMVLVLPARRAFKLHHVITKKHVSLINRMVLMFSLFVTYGYLQDFFFGWYSGKHAERSTYDFVFFGHYGAWFWAMIACTTFVPQIMWNKRARESSTASVFVALAVIFGAWCEQFVHIVPPLAHGHIPATWGFYAPSWVDLGLLFGTICFFGLMFIGLFKLVPLVAQGEVKEVFHKLVREVDSHDTSVPPLSTGTEA